MNVANTPPDIAALLQRLDAQVERLDAQDTEIQRLKAMVEPDGKEPKGPARSRRDLLKLAGAAVMGAAGAAALRVVPAAAANGDTLTFGGSFTGNNTTTLTMNGGMDAFRAVSSTMGSGVWGVGLAPSGVGVRGDAGSFFSAGGDNGTGVQGIGFAPGTLGGYFQGIRAPLNIQVSGAAGPPTTLGHARGDIWVDSACIVWVCIAGGTPGVFAPLQTGGANITHFVKVMNKQYSLFASDGQTWVDMDAINLVQTITPQFNAQAVISVSTDLWTANSGFNQDIGIFISGGAYTTGTIVAWKESGGSAGTYSPNAAFVETTQPFVAGTAYTIKVRWKTNQPAGAATIFAGAGPLGAGSAGGGVAGQISPTRLATHLVVDVPSPSVLRIPANDPTATPPAPQGLPRK
jgi:hypothetical protein